jgi:hypothetical protein
MPEQPRPALAAGESPILDEAEAQGIGEERNSLVVLADHERNQCD